jgi:hypothetical protein
MVSRRHGETGSRGAGRRRIIEPSPPFLERNPMVKHRNMVVQVLLCIITCGIYALYWFYATATEMKDLNADPEASPGLWTVLLFIPPFAFYSHYKYAEQFEDLTDFNKWILFILWLVFCPAVWFIVQTELNKRASLSPALA